MRDACDVLKQKEADLARVRHEVESLRIVAPLLVDDLDSDQSEKPHLMSTDDLLNIVRKTHPDLEASGRNLVAALTFLISLADSCQPRTQCVAEDSEPELFAAGGKG
jgi:hypothetical protein